MSPTRYMRSLSDASLSSGSSGVGPARKTDPAAYDSSVGRIEDALKVLSALLVTFPVGVAVYRLIYLGRLHGDPGLVGLPDRSSMSPRLTVIAICVVLVLTAPTQIEAPFWAYLVAFALLWLLLSLSFSWWSVRFQRRDRTGWLELKAGRRRPSMSDVFIYFVLPLVPTAALLAWWR